MTRPGAPSPVARAAVVAPAPAVGAAAPPPGSAVRPGADLPAPAGRTGAPLPHHVGGDEKGAAVPGGRSRPLSAGVGAIRGAPSEIRRQMRERRQVRLAVLVLACLLVLGALPLYFGIRAAMRDPVFDSLDALSVPAWAAADTVDAVGGSRWCFVDCRLRERTVTSQRGPDETAQAYEKALADAGWQPWKPSFCPDQRVQGHYTCWKRDELTLDLWVRKPACAADASRAEPTVAPPAGDPKAPAAQGCAEAVVSVKVRNAIDDDRTRPQPSTDPSLTGEDPDPVFTDDPLNDLSPTPS